MEKPKVSKQFLRDLQLVRPGLTPVWNDLIKRFHIFFKDPRNGHTRVVYTVEDPMTGEFRPLDQRVIIYLANNIAWESIDKYPDPKELWEKWYSKKLDKNKKEKIDREYYRRKRNYEMRKYWGLALDNARRGIFSLPKENERKIYLT